MLLHITLDLPYEAGVSFLWPLTAKRLGLFWPLPDIWAHIDQTMDFLFAKIFFYTLHRHARKYQTRGKLLILAVVASLITFLGMISSDLTGPSGDQWLLIYAGVGLPFLILIPSLPWVNARIIYCIPPRLPNRRGRNGCLGRSVHAAQPASMPGLPRNARRASWTAW